MRTSGDTANGPQCMDALPRQFPPARSGHATPTPSQYHPRLPGNAVRIIFHRHSLFCDRLMTTPTPIRGVTRKTAVRRHVAGSCCRSVRRTALA